jgi:chaperonin GroES
VVEEKSFPWDNAANIKFPLITEAAIQFNARAYPEIVKSGDVVKARVVGKGEPEKDAKGKRISRHMSYQLTEEMEEWEEGMDKLLIALPIVGTAFKKTYFDTTLQRNVSAWRRAEKIVYNYNSDFSRTPRITEIIELYPQEIEERKRSGVFRDVDLGMGQDDEKDEPQEILEQHRLLDLDEDGLKEPYIVTIHRESKEVLRIVPRYDVDDIMVLYEGQEITLGRVEGVIAEARQQAKQVMMAYEQQARAMMEQGIQPPPPPTVELPEFEQKKAKLIRIPPTQYYTKFGFIPSPDGAGYDLGLGHLLFGVSNAVDTLTNQLLDAGTLANMQGGFISRGLKVRGGNIRMAPGQWVPAENGSGASLRDSIVPMNYPGPSAALLNLLTFLVEAGKGISSVKDIMTGENIQNETATTTMARIEQGMKVFSAIYKRIYRSLKQEFTKLYKLNQKYLPDQVYFRVLDEEEAIARNDYDESLDVVPVADPGLMTAAQRLAQGQALLQFANDPYVNQKEIRKRYLESLQVEGVENLITDPPQQGPDPKAMELELKAAQQQVDAEKTKAEIAKIYADAVKSIAEAEAKEAGTQLEQYRTQLEQLRMEHDRAGVQPRPANGGGVQGMEGQPNDPQNLPPVEETPSMAQGQYPDGLPPELA